MSKSTSDPPRALSEHSDFAWKGARIIRRVHAVNERCLEVLSQLACSERHRTKLTIIDQQRGEWRDLTAAARTRAACAPFLLLDVHFKDAVWWRSATSLRAARQKRVGAQPVFGGKAASELMRETLSLAWSGVTFERGAAGIFFGMVPAVSSIVAELGPADIERIAARHSSQLRPRWEEYPVLWGKLLKAARAGDDIALHDIQLHGVQLIGSDLLSETTGALYDV